MELSYSIRLRKLSWIQFKEEEIMDELMIKIEEVTKEYRLGAIGGTTLRDELQRARAKRKKQEDPTLKIGQTRGDSNEKFLVLNGVSFEVKKGEAIGIIGHNGAGKSTLLKLITRITAPTSGRIYLNGRVASMLEVGTGFHPELTGRENVYLNGAILGMNKKEIDEKMEDIIDFSECRQFIDTPVKRYSSGMYVKLAFSVAAHLDSEIMIMDEVLAVGDVAFQNKCIKKMREVADSGRTILYVSHNMSTIRSLCDRCIVLSKGKVVFSGDVEDAISHYVTKDFSLATEIELGELKRPYPTTELCHMTKAVMDKINAVYDMGDKMEFVLKWTAKIAFDSMQMRIGIFTVSQMAVGITFSEKFAVNEGENEQKFVIDISRLLPGRYCLELIMTEVDDAGMLVKHDVLNRDVLMFEVQATEEKKIFRASNSTWGFYELSEVVCCEK